MNLKLFITVMLFFASCSVKKTHHGKQPLKITIPSTTIRSTDGMLHFDTGSWYYKNDLFSGHIIEKFANNNLHRTTSYFNGKEEGEQLTYFDDNRLAEKRFYHQGEKEGIHTGWWPNGNKRFEYRFTSGVYNGAYKEWYEHGGPLKEIHYTNGNDDSGKGWRQNGKLYMNFIVKNGRRYGLNNSNLCYTVKNGNGEYVVSATENFK